VAVKANQWPQADVLFHRDPRWLGSDAAYSTPLRDGRILWLFNDTLLETTRSRPDFVRNTIAIERAANPVDARMRFYWRTVANAPSSYFPEERSRVTPPRVLARFDPGKALNLFGDDVVSLAVPATGGTPFRGYLLRWHASELAAGRLDRAE
jgi:hypothetical protein